MGLGAWLLLPHYRRLARRNLEIVFANEKSARELRRIVRHHFQRLAANLICSAKMGSMRPENVARYVETGALDAGITGHDWVVETGADVEELAELVYAKQRLARVRWVLAVP